MESTVNSFAKADSFCSLHEAFSRKVALKEASYRASIRNPTCTSNRTPNWMSHRNWTCERNSVLGCFPAQNPGISALIAPASCTVGATLQRLSCYHSLTFARPNKRAEFKTASGAWVVSVHAHAVRHSVVLNPSVLPAMGNGCRSVCPHHRQSKNSS
jgi:hypothetical protein